MTLIVCLKADNCIILAADSLTTKTRGGVVSRNTKKIHKIAMNAAVAVCGLAKVNNHNWEYHLASYKSSNAPAALISAKNQKLKNFLDSIMSKTNPSNHGACSGGNTFLLAGYDQISRGMFISEITRVGDRRFFESDTPIVSCALATSHISWHGDTNSIATFIAMRTMNYSDKMSKNQALEFALDAIRDGIRAHSKPGIKPTIGGENIFVYVVSSKQIESINMPVGLLPLLAANSLCNYDWQAA